MARSIQVIQNQILANIAGDPNLSAMNSPSKRAYYNLLAYVVAVAIALGEQLIDIFVKQIETIVAAAAPATAAWLQEQIFLFQYSATNPQVIQFINFAPVYPIVDPTLRIISQCSVATSVANQVNIKVATGNPAASLSSDQLTALQDYINPPNGIGVAGVYYAISSGNPDNFYIQAIIFYLGVYSGVIEANVITAINNFLTQASTGGNFNGAIKISDLEATIKGVAGVDDVLFQNVAARADATAFSAKTFLIQNQQVVGREWFPVAGYTISETTSGKTLADSLIFQAI